MTIIVAVLTVHSAYFVVIACFGLKKTGQYPHSDVKHKENKRICGNCYNKKYDGYVFVDAMGNIFNPRSVTENFSKLLERNNLRHIRFHDLRHSCASLLLANDVPDEADPGMARSQ